jgi:hypothetical protein
MFLMTRVTNRWSSPMQVHIYASRFVLDTVTTHSLCDCNIIAIFVAASSHWKVSTKIIEMHTNEVDALYEGQRWRTTLKTRIYDCEYDNRRLTFRHNQSDDFCGSANWQQAENWLAEPSIYLLSDPGNNDRQQRTNGQALVHMKASLTKLCTLFKVTWLPLIFLYQVAEHCMKAHQTR